MGSKIGSISPAPSICEWKKIMMIVVILPFFRDLSFNKFTGALPPSFKEMPNAQFV